jgi:hypothetical protein
MRLTQPCCARRYGDSLRRAAGRWVSPIAPAPGVGDPIHFVPETGVVAADLALRSSPRPSAAFFK